MAIQEINDTATNAILATLQRMEVTLQALPDELAAARVTTLSEDDAKEILAKRYARINHYQKIDEKHLKTHRLNDNLNKFGIFAVLAAIAYFIATSS